jgi:quinol monooxygenase YgiN
MPCRHPSRSLPASPLNVPSRPRLQEWESLFRLLEQQWGSQRLKFDELQETKVDVSQLEKYLSKTVDDDVFVIVAACPASKMAQTERAVAAFKREFRVLKSNAQVGYCTCADTPFILLARVKVKPENVDEYLKIARAADEAVKASEPGMLHHTFDADPSDPTKFVWSEVYANDAALQKHLTSSPVSEYLGEHAKLAEEGEIGFNVELFGTVSDETKEVIRGAKIPTTYFETRFGYSRVA